MRRLKGNPAVVKAVTPAPKGVAPVKITKKPPGKEQTPEKPIIDTTKKKVRTDTIYMSADTIETQIMTYKDLKVYLEKQHLAHLPDTGIYKKLKAKDSKFLVGHQQGIRLDTNYRQPDFFGKSKVPVVKKKGPSKQQLHR